MMKLKYYIKTKLSSIDRRIGKFFWNLVWVLTEDKTEKIHYSILDENVLHDNFYYDFQMPDKVLHEYQKHIGEEYVLLLKPKTYILGASGWCFKNGSLISKSYPFSKFSWTNSYHPHFGLHLAQITFKRKTIINNDVVSFIWFGWTNYYHFIIDIVPTLDLLIEKLDPNRIDLLVPSSVKGVQFIDDYFKRFPIYKSKFNFIYISDNQVLEVQGNCILAKSSRLRLPSLDDKLIVENIGYKVYLTRSLEGGRAIRESKEFHDLLKGYNYDIVDTAKLSLDDQINLFSKTSKLIGIHGAGMTNMVFSQSQISVLEIFPKAPLKASHYKHLSKVLGNKYSTFIGGEIIEGSNNHFTVNLEELEKAIIKLEQL